MLDQTAVRPRSHWRLRLLLALVPISAQALLAAPSAAAGSASTVTLVPTADAYVTSDAPARNFGTDGRLQVDGAPVDVTLLAFDLTPYAGRRLTRVDLALRVTTNASADRPTVRLVGDETWTETGVTYGSRPAVGSAVLGTLGPTTAGTDHTVPLDPAAVTPELGSRLGLAVRSSGSDGLLLASRETATPPRLLLEFAEPATAPVTLPDLRNRALTAPNTLAHRLGGANIAGDNDLAALDRLTAEGWDGVVVDGGDLRQGSGSDFIPVMHDSAVDRTTTGTGAVSTFTAAEWTNLRLAAFPYTSPEADSGRPPPTYAHLLASIKRTRWFSHPEIKDPTIADEVVAEIRAQAMHDRVMVGSFRPAALVPARDAGLPTKLLVNERSNPGTGDPAAVDVVIGGTSGPTAVGYDYRQAPGKDDAWLAHQIRQGRDLEAYTFHRRKAVADEAARVRRLGGRLTFATSDDPVYTGSRGRLRTTDRFDTQDWEHGLVRSSKSRRNPVIRKGWLRFDDAEQAQWALLGALSGPVAPRHVELDLRWDALDTSPSGSVGVHYNQRDDRSAHDGSTTSPGVSAGRQGSGYLFSLGQDGQLRLTKDRADGTRTALASPVSSAPLVTGQVVRVRVGVTPDGRPFATRLDTGTTITSAAADSTYRGGYWSVGKSGHLGSRSSIGNVVVVP